MAYNATTAIFHLEKNAKQKKLQYEKETVLRYWNDPTFSLWAGGVETRKWEENQSFGRIILPWFSYEKEFSKAQNDLVAWKVFSFSPSIRTNLSRSPSFHATPTYTCLKPKTWVINWIQSSWKNVTNSIYRVENERFHFAFLYTFWEGSLLFPIDWFFSPNACSLFARPFAFSSIQIGPINLFPKKPSNSFLGASCKMVGFDEEENGRMLSK